MESRQERNKALVLEFLDALGSFDPERYEPYLTDEPVYWVGMNRQVGKQAFRSNMEMGKILYPDPAAATNRILAVLADGDWVSILQMRSGATNLVNDYENIYGIFCEVVDGRIATQVELLDSALAATKFDFGALENFGTPTNPDTH